MFDLGRNMRDFQMSLEVPSASSSEGTAMTHPNAILLKNHLLSASIFIYPELMTLSGGISTLPVFRPQY